MLDTTLAPTESGVSTLAALSSAVAKILSVDSVDPDFTLLELGLDSLSAVELTLACDQIYPEADRERLLLTKDTTLRDIDLQLANAA